MKGSYIASFLFIVGTMVLSCPAKAADGCLVSGVLYTSHTSKSGAYFYRAPNTIVNCGTIGTISGACRLYNSGDETKNKSYTRYMNSYSLSISVVVCPIDNGLWLVVIPLIGFTVYRFRLDIK